MASEKDDSLQAISVKLHGANYFYWAYVMKNFLMGKGMWGYVSGDIVVPSDKKAEKYADLLSTWQMQNSKIITWINNSVDISIGMQLAKFGTSKEIWEHLERLYKRSNFAKRYQLESDLRATKQGDKSIQDFYNVMTGLWDQLALTEPSGLSSIDLYCTYREEQRLVQFLMALRDDFEALRGSILHRNPLPSVDSVLNELLAEEVRLTSHAGTGLLPLPNQTVFAAQSRSFHSSQNKPRPRVAADECAFCKEKGHWKSQCPVLLNKKSQPQQVFPPKRSPTAAVVSSHRESSASPTVCLPHLLQVYPHPLGSLTQALHII
ncbi:unnamed protein product [Prunus armeniaca]|uniref:Uncharacterized protein n=1 Tax=Prunus armeniaca TaxID=36596 RepID=A0A6J5USR8_PRUAR|nr:unnamed protein product [Prunus armeniaca]